MTAIKRERVLFNPYTGERRHIADVQSDPYGAMIVPPGADVLALPREISDTEEPVQSKLKTWSLVAACCISALSIVISVAGIVKPYVNDYRFDKKCLKESGWPLKFAGQRVCAVVQ